MSLLKIKSLFSAAILTITALALSHCSGRDESSSKEPTAVAEPIAIADPRAAVSNSPITAPSVDGWLGKWIGPEGTFLVLSKQEDRYRIVIQSLDGPASYEGERLGERIEFARNGKTESIRATNGKDTGMKWLQEKTDCLTINVGEGFCRDLTSAVLSEPSSIGK